MTAPDPAAVREALKLVSDGPYLKEMTRHNAEDFVTATASLVAAALRWLDLIEGGTEVWWCETHKCSGEPVEVEHYDTGELIEVPNFAPGDCILSQYDARPGSCQVVKRRLVAL